jgi:hypothetical protein
MAWDQWIKSDTRIPDGIPDDHNAHSKPFEWAAKPQQNHRRRQARAPTCLCPSAFATTPLAVSGRAVVIIVISTPTM